MSHYIATLEHTCHACTFNILSTSFINLNQYITNTTTHYPLIMLYISDMSTMHTLVHVQSPGIGGAFVCAHLALHLALVINASTSSIVPII